MRNNFYNMHRTRLEEKLGADVVEDLDIWMRGIVSSEFVTKDQFGQIISRLDGLEDKIDGLENRIDVLDERTQNLSNEMASFRAEVNQRFLSIDQRLDSFRSEIEQRFDSFRSEMEQRFDSFRSDIDKRFDSLNERFDKLTEQMVSNIKWTVGTIALFGTIITVLITVFKFVKP